VAKGFTLPNLKNEEGENSGISLTLVDAWKGNKIQAVNGEKIYSEAVNATYYWDASPYTKKMKVSGLTPEKTYDFTFFANRLATGNRTAVYSINGEEVLLNAANNLDKTVTISQAVPNEQGEVIIEVRRTDNSSFAYLNSLIIKPNAHQAVPSKSSRGAEEGLIKDVSMIGSVTEEYTTTVYPNAISNRALVVLQAKQATDNVQVQITDLAGTPVFTSLPTSVPQGTSTITLDDLAHLNSGVYVLSVSFGKRDHKMVRIVKN
jgi:SHS2 domain-containing protein